MALCVCLYSFNGNSSILDRGPSARTPHLLSRRGSQRADCMPQSEKANSYEFACKLETNSYEFAKRIRLPNSLHKRIRHQNEFATQFFSQTFLLKVQFTAKFEHPFQFCLCGMSGFNLAPVACHLTQVPHVNLLPVLYLQAQPCFVSWCVV
jgi:hypothetical protein